MSDKSKKEYYIGGTLEIEEVKLPALQVFSTRKQDTQQYLIIRLALTDSEWKHILPENAFDGETFLMLASEDESIFTETPLDIEWLSRINTFTQSESYVFSYRRFRKFVLNCQPDIAFEIVEIRNHPHYVDDIKVRINGCYVDVVHSDRIKEI